VDPNFGTGAVKVTPGHDQNDFEMAQRHSLPFFQVFSETGHIDLRGGDQTSSEQILNDKGNLFKVTEKNLGNFRENLLA